MSRHDDSVSLRQMLDHGERAVRLSSGKSGNEIATDELLSLAIVRLLEVIGEAASRVSAEARLRHPIIPWRDIIDLRNRLIHGYDTIDFNVVRQILDDDVLSPVTHLEQILGERA